MMINMMIIGEEKIEILTMLETTVFLNIYKTNKINKRKTRKHSRKHHRKSIKNKN
jgi:hypothetical protein